MKMLDNITPILSVLKQLLALVTSRRKTLRQEVEAASVSWIVYL